jgi:hypothetical protein
MGSVIGDGVAAAIGRGFEPGGGSNQQPSDPPLSYGLGGLQNRIQPRTQETVNRQQRLHNEGTGAPAARGDFRTLSGSSSIKFKDRKVRLAAQKWVRF